MANEITLSASLAITKNDDDDDDLSVVAAQFNQTANTTLKGKVSVATSEQALSLPAGTLGWAIFRNLDYTNYLEIRSATGSSNDIIKIPARGVAMFHFGSDVTAPYAIANTAACILQFLIATV